MAYCKTAVTPLLEHWSYFSLTESHRYVAKMSYRALNFSEELNMNDTFRKGVFDG